MRQGRVVERAVGLVDPHRRAAEVGDELLGEGALGRVGGEAEDARAVEVDVGAGERHGRVEGDGAGADAGERGEGVGAVPAAGVQHDLAGTHDGRRAPRRRG